MSDRDDTSEPLEIRNSENERELASNFDLGGLILTQDRKLFDLLRVFGGELDTIDDEIQTLYDERHIKTATGEQLELIGELADIERETNEGDGRYRARVIGEIKAASSDTDFDTLVEFVSVLLDVSRENVVFERGNEAALLLIEVPEGAIADSPLNDTDVTELTRQAVPADHQTDVRTSGTFQFSSDSYDPPPNTGFGEGSFGRIVE